MGLLVVVIDFILLICCGLIYVGIFGSDGKPGYLFLIIEFAIIAAVHRWLWSILVTTKNFIKTKKKLYVTLMLL